MALISHQQTNDLLDAPNVIRYADFHRWGYAQRLVSAGTTTVSGPACTSRGPLAILEVPVERDKADIAAMGALLKQLRRVKRQTAALLKSLPSVTVTKPIGSAQLLKRIH
jgi:hypothetical protein